MYLQLSQRRSIAPHQGECMPRCSQQKCGAATAVDALCPARLVATRVSRGGRDVRLAHAPCFFKRGNCQASKQVGQPTGQSFLPRCHEIISFAAHAIPFDSQQLTLLRLSPTLTKSRLSTRPTDLSASSMFPSAAPVSSAPYHCAKVVVAALSSLLKGRRQIA